MTRSTAWRVLVAFSAFELVGLVALVAWVSA
jgi:hypothetical protein